MLYILIILYIFFCIIQYDANNQGKKNDTHFTIVFFILILLSSIQYRMGADIIPYMSEFEYYNVDYSLNYLFGFSSRRPLWVLLNIIIKDYFASFVVLKTIIAIFVNMVIARFILKRSRYKYTALLLYFIVLYFHFNYNVLRNSIAICFFLLSLDSLDKKKYLPYILFNCIGFGFHESIVVPAILSLFIILFKLENKNKFILPSLVLLGFTIPLLPNSIRDFFQLASLYYDTGIVGDRAVHYLNKDNYSDFALSLYGYIEWIIKLLFFLWVYYKYSQKQGDKQYLPFLFIFVLISILNNALPILYRVAEFYTMIYLVCITDILENISYERLNVKKVFVVFVAVFYVHAFFLFTDEKEIYQYYPYTSIIDKKTVSIRERMYGEREYLEYIK